jgi:hypothetical protein
MTGEPFEYAIKKDVRNNPIVREVDRERHREMWRSAGVGVFLVFVLVLFVWRHTDLFYQGKREHDIQVETEEILKQNKQLRIQIETARAPERIAQKAGEQLHMFRPALADRPVIERAVTSPQPAGSVLARR